MLKLAMNKHQVDFARAGLAGAVPDVAEGASWGLGGWFPLGFLLASLSNQPKVVPSKKTPPPPQTILESTHGDNNV